MAEQQYRTRASALFPAFQVGVLLAVPLWSNRWSISRYPKIWVDICHVFSPVTWHPLPFSRGTLLRWQSRQSDRNEPNICLAMWIPAQVLWVIHFMENCSFFPFRDPGNWQWYQTQVCPRTSLTFMLYCSLFSPGCQMSDQVTSFHDPKYVRTLYLVSLDAVISLLNSDFSKLQITTVICSCNQTGGLVIPSHRQLPAA